MSDSAISKSMLTDESPGAVALKKGEGLYVAATPPPSSVPPVKPTLDQVLSVYNHRAKPENPVYSTAGNDIGSKYVRVWARK